MTPIKLKHFGIIVGDTGEWSLVDQNGQVVYDYPQDYPTKYGYKDRIKLPFTCLDPSCVQAPCEDRKMNFTQNQTIIDANGNTFRFKKYMLHCEDGPAVEGTEGEKLYWIHGVMFEAEEYFKIKKGTEHWTKIMGKALGSKNV